MSLEIKKNLLKNVLKWKAKPPKSVILLSSVSKKAIKQI